MIPSMSIDTHPLKADIICEFIASWVISCTCLLPRLPDILSRILSKGSALVSWYSQVWLMMISWESKSLVTRLHGQVQGDPTQVTGLPQPLVQSYVDRFQNPFSHLTTTLGDLIEHIKHLGTCTITWETNPISFILMYRFSFNPLSFPNAKC